jgi:hypothetical protein
LVRCHPYTLYSPVWNWAQVITSNDEVRSKTQEMECFAQVTGYSLTDRVSCPTLFRMSCCFCLLWLCPLPPYLTPSTSTLVEPCSCRVGHNQPKESSCTQGLADDTWQIIVSAFIQEPVPHFTLVPSTFFCAAVKWLWPFSSLFFDIQTEVDNMDHQASCILAEAQFSPPTLGLPVTPHRVPSWSSLHAHFVCFLPGLQPGLPSSVSCFPCLISHLCH